MPSECAPGDVFVDGEGGVWIVNGFCAEPTVKMQKVYPYSEAGEGRDAGVSGLLWKGFRRVARDPQIEKGP